jgi:protein gp37
VPASAKEDISYRNVFTCSMADLFGRWVPAEWIEAVLEQVKSHPEWNFLFLTKFPKRMAEFNIPRNAWMGTTVDMQIRVKAAEQAFRKVDCEVKWLSIEPMLEPLKFEHLGLFNWIVIGGASKSSLTPAWTPPLDWIVDLHRAARAAGARIFYKTNAGLGDELRVKEFPWEEPKMRSLPDSLKYLGKE